MFRGLGPGDHAVEYVALQCEYRCAEGSKESLLKKTCMAATEKQLKAAQSSCEHHEIY